MNPYLTAGLRSTPVIIERLLRRIPHERRDVATAPDRFTLREVIAHLAEWEPIMRERIRTAELTPGAGIEAYDEEEMAIANDYAHSDFESQLALFCRERAATVAYLEEFPPVAWSRTVVHPGRGETSAADLANLLLGHDLYHIEQITLCLE